MLHLNQIKFKVFLVKQINVLPGQIILSTSAISIEKTNTKAKQLIVAKVKWSAYQAYAQLRGNPYTYNSFEVPCGFAFFKKLISALNKANMLLYFCHLRL